MRSGTHALRNREYGARGVYGYETSQYIHTGNINAESILSKIQTNGSEIYYLMLPENSHDISGSL